MTTKQSLGSDAYTLDKATADKYIGAWKNGRTSIVSTAQPATTTNLQLNAFTFAIQDFKDFVSRVDSDPLNDEITGVVCHIGMKPNPIVGALPPQVPCLIFEAVLNYNPNATPINPGQCLGELVPLEGSEGASEVVRTSARYDFTYPCPATCPAAEV
jgi:hypothetical protein